MLSKPVKQQHHWLMADSSSFTQKFTVVQYIFLYLKRRGKDTEVDIDQKTTSLYFKSSAILRPQK